MTTTAWAHLPNVEQIDRVLAHLKAHPERWSTARSAAWDMVSDVAWSAARNVAWNTADDAARSAARDALVNTIWNTSWPTIRDAVLALATYNDCAHYLDLPPGAVRVAASAGIPAAILLLPAVIAMESV